MGVVTAAHGIRGEVKIRTFAADPASLGVGPLSNEDGSVAYEIVRHRKTKGGVIAVLGGVRNRTAAEALRGTRLYVARSALPAIANNEYDHDALIGLSAKSPTGHPLGTVVAVHNFGAGDLLDIERPDGGTFLVPFSEDFVPAVEPRQFVVVDAPDDWIAMAPPARPVRSA